jgi:hypothetical protein
MVLGRLFIGASLSATWLCFSDLDRNNHPNLCFLSSIVRNISLLLHAGGSRVTINGKIVEIQKNTRIFFTASETIFRNDELPSSIRSLLRPIAFPAPDLRLVTEMKLGSLGFKTVKYLSVKLTSVLQTLLSTFDYLGYRSVLALSFAVLDQSQGYLQQLIHSSGSIFINYYDQTRIAEEYVIARSIHTHLSPNLQAAHMEPFWNLLYSAFRIFDDITLFKTHILDVTPFAREQVDALVYDSVLKTTGSRLLAH